MPSPTPSRYDHVSRSRTLAEPRRRQRHTEADRAERELPPAVDLQEGRAVLALLGIDPAGCDRDHVTLLGDAS